GLRQYQAPILGRRVDGDIRWQAIALVEIENDEALQEGDASRLIAVASCPLALASRHETVGIDDCGSAFALADMTAQRTRLTKSKPALDGMSALDRRTPQKQHIDAGIVAAG